MKMDGTSAERVQDWYDRNLGRLSEIYGQTVIRSFKPEHQVDGKIIIEVESRTFVAMVTFWNKGDVEVIRLDLPTKDSVVIDDPVRSENEDVAQLLDSYFEQLRERDST